MRSLITASLTATLTLISSITVDCQACTEGSAQEINGNWYCSEVKAITYQNFPGNGSYHKVVDMDEKTGECETEKFQYSGSLAPLNEELSLHVRGPIWLKQVAVYMPSSPETNKRSTKHGGHSHRHGERHEYVHEDNGEVREINKREVDKRSVGQLVSATIDGQVVSWTNEYAGLGVASGLPSPVDMQVDKVNVSALDETSDDVNAAMVMTPKETSLTTTQHPSATVAYESKAIKPSKNAPGSLSGSIWTRRAYYDAAGVTADGITFLNHFGGMDGIPGTAAGGPAFGASLSYASTDGKTGAKSPQILKDAPIEDDVEVIIMSNQSCSDRQCGFARPGGVNYHGFAGSEKVFLFEFSMPDTGETGFNANMPAIWVLNAQVPRTSQYGTNPDCSCWTSGCGEFDLFEVLESGNFRCKSTLHMEPAGGSSDWFRRPTGGSLTAALVVGGHSEVAAIRVLDQGQPFSTKLSGSVIDHWLSTEGSVFKMAT